MGRISEYLSIRKGLKHMSRSMARCDEGDAQSKRSISADQSISGKDIRISGYQERFSGLLCSLSFLS